MTLQKIADLMLAFELLNLLAIGVCTFAVIVSNARVARALVAGIFKVLSEHMESKAPKEEPEAKP